VKVSGDSSLRPGQPEMKKRRGGKLTNAQRPANLPQCPSALGIATLIQRSLALGISDHLPSSRRTTDAIHDLLRMISNKDAMLDYRQRGRRRSRSETR
jgi:hypothetical protein